MLTPGKIRGYQFQPASRGCYKAEEVDEFLNQIVESYEQVFKENGELVRKLSIIATKLDEYRREESTVRKALANAQLFIDKMVADAKKERVRIIADANDRAKNVDSITNAKIKVVVDEVEAQMRVAYDKATSQAKSVREKAAREAETKILEAKEKCENMIYEATEKSNELVEKGKAKYDELVNEAVNTNKQSSEKLKAQIEEEKIALEELKKATNIFKTELVELYQRQLQTVEQIPEYEMDKSVEDAINKIIEEEPENQGENIDRAAVDKLVDSFIGDTDSYFNAEDLLKHYSDPDNTESPFEKNTDISEDASYNATKSYDDISSKSFIFDEIKTDDIKTEEPSDSKEQNADEYEYISSGADEYEDISSGADEYEDISSSSDESHSIRFTKEDFEDIKSIEDSDESSDDEKAPAEEEKEVEEPVKYEENEIVSDSDFDFFDENAKIDEHERKERPKGKFDIAFSKKDAVEIEKDEDMFLSEKEPEQKQGFKLFDDIDKVDETDKDVMSDDSDIKDSNDVFASFNDDETDDAENYGFLKNLFGKKD